VRICCHFLIDVHIDDRIAGSLVQSNPSSANVFHDLTAGIVVTTEEFAIAIDENIAGLDDAGVSRRGTAIMKTATMSANAPPVPFRVARAHLSLPADVDVLAGMTGSSR
jgi:hypothetical protein